jgi:hypothetical protein
MKSTTGRIHRRALLAGVLLVAGVARAARAGDAPPPAASAAPAPVVSDKAPLGCCCVVADPASSAKPGCSYGLSEDKCRTAGHVLPQWESTWTPGKCPAP